MDQSREEAIRELVYALSPEIESEHILNKPGVMPIHDEQRCRGTFCTYHNPSDHHMVEWPKYVRASGLIERTCTHGVGHPDPDSVEWIVRVTGQDHWYSHGCDGCCANVVTEL